MSTPVDTLRTALFGNPPSATYTPSREGTLQAFTELYDAAIASINGATPYATVAALPVVTGANNGDQARVYADATAANNTYWIVKGGAWMIDADLIASIATVVQPLVDEAEGFADEASTAVLGNGRINMFADEYFQISDGNLDLLSNGRNVYNSGQRNATWQDDAVFAEGFGAWRHPATTALFGFNLDLLHAAAIQMGLAEGEVFSFGMMVRGTSSGKGVSAAYRFYSGADTNFVTAQAGTQSITTDGNVQVIKIENITWSIGADGVTVYTWNSGSAGTYDILGVWFVRGAAAGDRPPTRRNNDVLDRIIRADTSIGDTLEAVDEMAALTTTVTYSSQTIQNGAVSPASPPTRDLPFSGWGDAFAKPSDADWDGGRLSTLNRHPDAIALWGTVNFVLKTHATDASSAAATVIAVSTVYVDEDVAPLSDLVWLWRDPVTNDPIRVTEADMLADVFFGYYAKTVNGDPAACSEVTGSTSGLTHRQSYYHSAGDPLGGGWTNFSGNPALAFEMLTLTGAESTEDWAPKQGWVEKNAAALRAIGELAPRQNRIHGARLVRFRRYIADNTLGTPGRYIIGAIGDSWTASSNYYLSTLARLLIATFGDGGVGWCSFGYGTGSPIANNNTGADARGLYFRNYTSGWTSNYRNGSTSPDVSDIRSSTAGDTFTLDNIAGASHPGLTGAKLHFTGTADGVIKWRWSTLAAWSANTNVQGTVGAQQTLNLTGWPTAALVAAAQGTVHLEIQVVSGSVIIGGVDLQSSANGIVIHKLGSSGAMAQSFIANDATQWQTGFAALNCNGAQIFFGTNEQAGSQAPDLYVDYMIQLANRVLTATPGCDLLLVTSPENLDSRPIPMPRYAGALAAAADDIKAAICDLQPAFGRASAPTEYGPASAYPLIIAVGNPHPDITNQRGPIAIAKELDTMWRLG